MDNIAILKPYVQNMIVCKQTNKNQEGLWQICSVLIK